MKKLIATLFLAALAFGSTYGCVVDDGYGRGRPGGHHPGDRDDRRDERRDDHRDDRRDGHRHDRDDRDRDEH